MADYPTTRAEALKKRYGECAGTPDGQRYVIGRCAAEVGTRDRLVRSKQCNHKSGHGPSGLYCKRHGREVEEIIERRTRESLLSKIAPHMRWHALTERTTDQLRSIAAILDEGKSE